MGPTRTAAVACALVAISSSLVGAATRRAFVTSTTYDGNLAALAGGGSVLDKADAACRARAAAGGLPNAATYRAWLSTTTTDAYCHVQGLTGKRSANCGQVSLPAAGGPWYLSNGSSAFTGSLADLFDPAGAEIYRPVLLDEFGDELASVRVYWTGTYSDGSVISTPCDNWTSADPGDAAAFGSSIATTRFWTFQSYYSCDLERRLLCFEPGASQEAVVRWSTPASLAFVTSSLGSGDLSTWAESGGLDGLAGGDAICQARARAGKLPAPDSFVAWLSDATTDAGGRLTGNAGFRRRDAFEIAKSKADLLDGELANSIHVDELGYLDRDDGGFTWTGTYGDGTRHAAHCDGWSSEAEEVDGLDGRATLARTNDWTAALALRCDADRHLFCFSNEVLLFWDDFERFGGLALWSDAAP